MFFKKKKILGVDIGASSIKIAELDASKKSATLQNFGLIPTPAAAMPNGDILEPQAIADAIKQLVADIKTKRTDVATGLWGSSVIVKRVSIPKMDESLVSEQIRWEAEQYIPYDINDVNLDFKILNTNTGTDNMEILLIAAVQDTIFRVAEVIHLADLNCAVLDVEGFALANCFEMNYGANPGQTVALVNIGATATNFVIIESGEVVFCRDIPVGGNTYTNEIARALSVSQQEAEALKLSLSRGQSAPEQAAPVIDATHDLLVEEYTSSIEFFQNTSSDGAVGSMFITGGGSKIPGLTEKLSGIAQVHRFDPFQNIKPSSKVFSAEYIEQIRDFSAVVLGFGLRKAGDS